MVEGESRFSTNSELGEIRIRLDQMTERITSRLKDRSRFPINDAVYQPDGVPIVDRSGISLLQFALEGLETYHASLGRYEDSEQYPVLGLNLPVSNVKTTVESQPQRLKINSADNLLPFYIELVRKHCKPGENPNSFGETAYIDADLIQMIHERVNIGRHVAEVKGKSDPSIFELKSDNEYVLSKLKDKQREEALIDKVRNAAQRYELNPDMAEDAFRWMIDKTIEIEIAYIQQVGEPPK